jgi:hypothetical protein
MGAFRELIESKGLTAEALLRASAWVEARDPANRALDVARQRKRALGTTGSYAEAGIAKPRSGRGVGQLNLDKALSDQPVPPAVRGKLVRAFNALIVKKGGEAVDVRAIFGDVPSKRKRPKTAS